jgi:hypothetical protein
MSRPTLLIVSVALPAEMSKHPMVIHSGHLSASLRSHHIILDCIGVFALTEVASNMMLATKQVLSLSFLSFQLLLVCVWATVDIFCCRELDILL